MKNLWFKKVTVMFMSLVLLFVFTACSSSENGQNNGQDMEQNWAEENNNDIPYDYPQTDGGNVRPDDPFADGNVTPDDPFADNDTPNEVYTNNDIEEMPHVMIQKDAIVGEWEHESGDFNYYLYSDDRYEVREGQDVFYGTYSFDGEVILLDDGSGFPVNGTFDFSDGGHLYIEGGMGRFYFNGK